VIPLKDDNPRIMFPFVTVLLILVNIGVFIYQSGLGQNINKFVYSFGAVPYAFTHHGLLDGQGLYTANLPPVITIFSSMFLHGGLLHLAGNMLYLWIFGDNVEGIMGHLRFLIFYIICGVVAALSHIILNPESTVPIIGASGAISGILGAYAVKFPAARVHVLFIIIIFIKIIAIPAVIVLGIWFVIQILSSMAAGQTQAGVAWFAHIGGFLSGIFFVFIFQKKELLLRAKRKIWL